MFSFSNRDLPDKRGTVRQRVANRMPARACQSLGKYRAQVVVKDREISGAALELGIAAHEQVDVRGNADGCRRTPSGNQQDVAQPGAGADAIDVSIVPLVVRLFLTASGVFGRLSTAGPRFGWAQNLRRLLTLVRTTFVVEKRI